MDEVKDLLALSWIEIGKGQVVKFPFEGEDIELGGNGRVNFDGLEGNALPLGLGQMVQRAQIVQPVGQLDDEHAKAPARMWPSAENSCP